MRLGKRQRADLCSRDGNWKKLPDISLGNNFFGYDPKNKNNTSKNQQMGLHKNKKALTQKKKQLPQ